MGIVFGKQKDNVKVLTIRETQSLPAVRIQRKFGKGSSSDLSQKTRSTSYQTTLPGLPNLISSDDDDVQNVPVQVPPPFTLPPLSHKLSLVRDNTSTTKVVAELSSPTSEEYSSCVEDLTVRIEREKTTLIREILRKRLDEFRTIEKHTDPLSSRESRKILSSRDSYRKTYLRSRKRARKNRCLSEESSLSKSNSWVSEDTLPPSGDETVSDVKVLISARPAKRNVAGCRISRKSTLNSTLRFNSSSDEGLPEFAIRYHLSRRDRRTRRDRIHGRKQIHSVVNERTSSGLRERTKSGVRVSSAWHGHSKNQSKYQPLPTDQDSYDASSELSSSDSDDELNYSNRFKTNPFLSMKTSLYFRRQQTSVELKPSGSGSMQPELVNILPNYAKSSYNVQATTSQHLEYNRNGRRSKTYASRQKALKVSQPNVRSLKGPGLSQRSQFMINKPSVTEEKPKRQNDEFDELDSAVEMFKLLL